jgi:hypothetical protein
MQRRSGEAGAALLVILGACTVVEPPLEDIKTQAIGGGSCAEQICGLNSPMIDLIGFHELNLLGAPNKEGFAIETLNKRAQIVQGTRTYDLRVRNGVITGERNGVTMLSGAGLVGAEIPIRRGAKRYSLDIGGVHAMTYFVAPADPIEAYTLAFHALGAKDQSQPLCNNIQGLIDIVSHDKEQGRFELMGMTPIESVVYEGDRVDDVLKTMSQVADNRWFNIGCAGHTLSKLRLTHNTIQSQVPGISRPWEQRQATLKMLVADYCGDGTVFTVAGQRLVWQGDAVSYFSPPGLLEARWTETGAACLYAPRMLFPSTPLGPVDFPDIWNQIKAVCAPLICADTDPVPFDGADRVSANP